MAVTIISQHPRHWILRDDKLGCAGYFSMEIWEDNYWTPHYTVYDEFQRCGYATKAVDFMRKIADRLDLQLVWSAEIKYRGRGAITRSGIKFARSYCKKNGLKNPRFNHKRIIKR